MNHYHPLLFLLLLVTISVPCQTTLITYNLRYDNPGDGINCWADRREDVVRMIRYYQPDILGIQEGLVGQVHYLDSSLADYDFTGLGREDGATRGEFAAIFFNKERLRLLDTRTWWLSETPDTVSVGWDAALERIVTYGKFLALSSGDTFYVFNTHFDHIGQIAREQSADLILQIIDRMGIWEKRIVVMGDLNAVPAEASIRRLSSRLEDPWAKNDILRSGPEGTFNAFDTEAPVDRRIDYIFVKNVDAKACRHIADRRANGLWPSDHLPVMVQLD